MKVLLFFCALLLFIGIFNLPIEYYTILRIIVCMGGISILITEFKEGLNFWTSIAVALTLLFNPIFPVYLNNKESWIILDLISGIVFLIKMFDLKLGK